MNCEGDVSGRTFSAEGRHYLDGTAYIFEGHHCFDDAETDCLNFSYAELDDVRRLSDPKLTFIKESFAMFG